MGAGPPRAGSPARDGNGGLIALALATGLILPFALVHLDDADGVVYAVVARNLARDGRLFDLQFLPTIFPAFREHPPFFFWLWAGLVRAGAAWALPWVGAACGVATVAIAFALGRHLAGPRAAFLGGAVLATIESFFRYQARARLDPPLTLLFTASVALLVLGRGRALWLVGGGLAAGLGVLVKGPPALGAPVAAALALAALGRSREIASARAVALVALPAVAPAALFLGFDRAALGGTWWRGYVLEQVLASALGRRQDGATSHLYLLRSVLGRLGPWVAPLAWAVVQAVRGARRDRTRAVSATLLWAAVLLGGYSMAGRAWWHYAMPAYVPLALAAGVGLDDLVERSPRAFATIRRAVAGAALALVLALPLRLARLVVPPCSLGELPALRAPPQPGTRVGLVRGRLALVEAGILADHAGLVAVPLGSAAELSSTPLSIALVEAGSGAPPGWTEVGRQGPWVELRRAPR